MNEIITEKKNRKEETARYREKYRERLAAEQREYRKKHPDKIKKSVAKNYKEHKTERLRYAKEYYDKQKEKPGFFERMRIASKEKYKRWIEKNPLAGAQRNHRRRSMIDGCFTTEEWTQLCEKYDYKCLCCGEKDKLEIDHVLPVSKGGSNTIDNLQPLCISCNRKKGTKHIDYR